MSWGSAEFIAAEEMGRFRGYWWSPDGTALAVTPRRHRAGAALAPRRPGATRRPRRASPLPGGRHAQRRRHAARPRPRRLESSTSSGTASVPVPRRRALVGAPGCSSAVQSRDQRDVEVLDGRPDDRRHRRSAVRRPRRRRGSSSCPACPGYWPDGGALVDVRRPRRRPPAARRRRAGDTRPTSRCAPSRRPTPTASCSRQPARRRHGAPRLAPRPGGALEALTDEPGVHAVGRRRADGRRAHATLAEPGASVGHARRRRAGSRTPPCPTLRADVYVRRSPASGALATAVLLPHDHDGSPLPVLLDPYGGPHALRVVRAPQRPPRVAVVRRPGLRRRRRRRPGHPGPRHRSGSGPCTSTSPAPCSTTRSTRSSRRPPSSTLPRPRPRRHPRLELRRLPRRARRAAPTRRVPRRRRRRAGHRVAPLRHPLHRALPRRSRRRSPRCTTPTRCCRSPPT